MAFLFSASMESYVKRRGYCFPLHLFPRPNECQQNALHHHPPTKQQNSWFRGAFMSTYSEACNEDRENISPDKLWNSQQLSLALNTSTSSSILVWISPLSSIEIPSTNHNSKQLYWAPAELCHITNKRTEKKSPDYLWLFWLARISS